MQLLVVWWLTYYKEVFNNMYGNLTQFLSVQDVRISTVVKPRLKIHCTAAE